MTFGQYDLQLRDRDAIFGDVFRRRVASMGIGEVVSAPSSVRATSQPRHLKSRSAATSTTAGVYTTDSTTRPKRPRVRTGTRRVLGLEKAAVATAVTDNDCH